MTNKKPWQAQGPSTKRSRAAEPRLPGDALVQLPDFWPVRLSQPRWGAGGPGTGTSRRVQ